MQTCQIMNKLISANYWFGCDWGFYEVGYLGLHAGQLSLACAVVYLWNTGYLRVTRPRLYPGIQQYIFSFSLFILIDTVHYAIFGFHFHVGSFLYIE